jgi:hypothetical protein
MFLWQNLTPQLSIGDEQTLDLGGVNLLKDDGLPLLFSQPRRSGIG